MSSAIDHINEQLLLLQSEEYIDRESAVKELGNYQTDEAIAGLVMSIEDPDPGIREIAADLLAKSHGSTAAQLLINFMGNEDIATRNLAAEILVKIGPETVPYLISEIDDEDSDVRKFVVDVLGLIKDKQAVDALCQKLWDENINVVCSAAEALGEIGNKKAIPALVAVYDKIEESRLPAIEALGKIGDSSALEHLYNYISSDDPMVQYAAIEALGTIGDAEAIKKLVPIMNSKDKAFAGAAFKAVVEIYLTTEGKIDFDIPMDTFAPFLFDGIKNKDKKITEFTLVRLKNWYGSDVIMGLLDVIDSADESFRNQIIDSLSQVGPSVCNYILGNFDSLTTETKLLTMEIFRQYIDQELAKKLVPLANDTDERIRTKIAHLLGNSGYTDGINTLKELAKDENGHVRAAAFAAIGWLCSEDDIDILLPGLYDPYVDVRSAAVGAMVVVGGEKISKEFYKILFEGDEIRQKLAIQALAFVGDNSAIEPLKLGLNNPDPEIRKSSVVSIARIGDESIVSSLKGVLNDEDSAVRKAVVTALVCLRREDAVEDIKYMLDDPDMWVVYHTVSAIGDFKNEDHADLILPFLNHEQDIVKIAAIKALTAMNCKRALPQIEKFLLSNNNDISEIANESFKKLKE